MEMNTNRRPAPAVEIATEVDDVLPLYAASRDADLVEVVREINTALPLRKITDRLERMVLSADVKAILLDLARISVKVGEVVLQIGRKILTVVFEILSRFPNTIFGVVIGVAIGMLIGSIPFLGAVLAPVLTPLMIAYGLTKGAIADLSNQKWASSVRDLEARLARMGA